MDCKHFFEELTGTLHFCVAKFVQGSRDEQLHKAENTA